VSRSYVIYIALLAAFWGASYMFIKVAGRAFEPAAMIMLRLVIASSLLLVVLAVQRGWHRTVGEMRALGWEGFALGVVNAIEGPGNAQFVDPRFACGAAPCFMIGGQDAWFLQTVIGKAAGAGVLDKLKTMHEELKSMSKATHELVRSEDPSSEV